MRVLVVTNMWPNKSTPWLGTFVKKQVESLKACGIDIDVHNIRSKKSNGTNLNYLKALYFILLKVFSNKYDYIHSHHWICWLVTFPFFWLEKVYTVHEGEFFLGGYRRFFIDIAIRNSSKVVFVNNLMYEQYVKLLPNKSERFFFIPSGVDDSIFSCIDLACAKKKLGLSLDKKYIFFPASSQRREKNSAFLSLWNQNYNKTPNVEVIWGGNINYNDMPYWFSAAHCCISLGDYESDGMVVKESLACGTPVISFDVGNSRLYIPSDICGFVIERDIFALDKAIMLLTSREQKYSDLLDKKFYLDEVAKSLSRVYHSNLK